MCAPDIPDTSAATKDAIAANSAISNRELDQQQSLMDYYMSRQDKVDDISNQVSQRELGLAEEEAAQGKDLFDYQKQVFRPVEESLADQAMQDSTPTYYEQFARDAMATQANANATSQAALARTLAGMGVNPNSGAYTSAMRGQAITNAAAVGAAGNTAREQAQQQSWNERAGVANLGRGLVGAGNASYGLATGSNTAASGAQTSASGAAAGTMGTPAAYGSLGVTAAGNAANEYTNLYQAQVQASMQTDPLMSALGSGAGYFLASPNAAKLASAI
ncbi:hypothetical protein [Candidimonas nitroreducens]|uniref:Uncharacterized protein n=1 Tax=Candidimonas nitroreducens TaxID=683354 RepID=A0A225M4W3_9BURK|nr:hypothetical protein [Candidimonas nitroreducens]OWT55283.1 hypothetical protein CEY11_21475 [Candidimonas nitroreducens]